MAPGPGALLTDNAGLRRLDGLPRMRIQDRPLPVLAIMAKFVFGPCAIGHTEAHTHTRTRTQSLGQDFT